jgi:thiamine biosynthesis lipoprotein
MPPDRAVTAHHFEALGTTCSLFGVGLPAGRLLEGELWVRRAGARLTRFSERSELSALNRSAGRWYGVSDCLEAILRISLQAYKVSGGLVNIAVQPAMVAAGYVRPLSEHRPTATPTATTTARALPVLPDVLEVRRGAARLQAGSALDLGGIAKGWMADHLVLVLGANAVANLGGDLMASGRGPAGRGWPVSVAGTTLLLRDQGAATSSVRRRRWGVRHHLIDPRTGVSSTSGLDEVSVVATSGVEAEVVAKTALLAGPDIAPAYCATHALAWSLKASP